MFTPADTPVKFVALLVLFAWCTVWCGYELTRPQDRRRRVSNIMHLVMAVVMLLMVAGPTWHGVTALVPVPVFVVGFAASTLWFAWLSIESVRASDRRGRRHFAGHAMMFGAMTWHLAAMAVMAARMVDTGGMGHGGIGAQEAARQPGGVLWVFALGGLPFMAYLLAASAVAVRNLLRPRAVVNDACRCGQGCSCGPECACSFTHAPAQRRQREFVGAAGAVAGAPVAPVALAQGCREERPVGSAGYRLAAGNDVAMNLGMFWMSTGLMVPILPFFALLSF